MELLQLKYFCHAAETQNFSKTAKEFSVPTSNISQMVHRLENELGANLFDRSANRIHLNEKGKLFYAKIKEGLQNISEGERIVADDKDIKGEIRLCVCTNRRLVTEVIGQFRNLYPDVTFLLSFDNDNQNFDLLIDANLDSSNLEKTELIEEKIILAVCEKQHAVINRENLNKLKFITMSKDSNIHKITKEICNTMGFEPNIVIQTDDPYYLREYVSMGLGAAFFPEKSWKGQFPQNVKVLDVTNYRRTTYAYRYKNRYVSKAVKIFLDMLVNASKKY